MVKSPIIGLDTKTHWLTDRQSQRDSDSDSDSDGDVTILGPTGIRTPTTQSSSS
jgi:hypothetical protein